MQQDISRLRAHLQQPDFHFQELRLEEGRREACDRWPLLAAIFSTRHPAPTQPGGPSSQ